MKSPLKYVFQHIFVLFVLLGLAVLPAQAQTVKNKKLYLSSGATLDRIDPANPAALDNTVESSAALFKETVVFDASSFDKTSNSGNTSPLTFSHTTGNFSGRYLIVTIGTSNTSAITGVSYNGVALSKIVGAVNGAIDAELWGLANPSIAST